jgi:hypothetical protein
MSCFFPYELRLMHWNVAFLSSEPIPAIHVVYSCGSLRILCASWAKICFVNMPRERNVTPALINSSKRFSPAWLIAVRFLKSITSSRSWRSDLAFSQAVLNSPAQDAMRLPSKINRRCVWFSAMEILGMQVLAPMLTGKCKPHSNPSEL